MQKENYNNKAMVWFIMLFLCSSFVFGDSPAVDDWKTLALWNMENTFIEDEITYISDDTSNTNRPALDLNISYSATGLGNPVLTTGNSGKFGEALAFDTDIAVAYNFWDAYDSVEIDFWMNVDVLPSATGTIMYIMRTGVWDLYIDADNLLRWGARKDSTGTGVGYVSQDLTGLAGQWLHVIAKFNRDLTMSLTVNGNTATGTATEMWWLRSGDNLHLGHTLSKPVDRAFKGKIDNLKFSIPSFEVAKTDDWETITLLHMDSTAVIDNNTYVIDDTSNTGRDAKSVQLTAKFAGLGDPVLTAGNGGLFGEALVFDTDYALIRDVWKGYDSVVIDFWMNADVLPSTTGKIMYIMRTGVWDLYIDTLNQLRWTARNSGGGGVGVVSQNLTGLEDKWVHVIAKFNSDLTMSLTVNRNTVSSVASEMWWLRENDSIQVGYLTSSPDVGRAFNGMIDELKISVPTVESPAYIHVYDDDEFNVFGLWHMDEFVVANGKNLVVDDDSNSVIPRDHDMIAVISGLSGGMSPTVAADEHPQPTGSSPGEFGSSMYFDGWDDLYLEANTPGADGTDMLGISLNNVRYEAWYKLSQNAIDWEQSGGYWPYWICFQDANVKLLIDRYFNANGTTQQWRILARFRLNDQNGNYLNEYVAYIGGLDDSSPLINGWHHIAGEYVNNTIRLYVDGELVAVNNAIPANAVAIRSPASKKFRIGRNFWGWIDEVRVSQAIPEVPPCGSLGYLEGDINRDCRVDFGDMQILVTEWLNEKGTNPDSGVGAYPNLTPQGWQILGNYNIPLANVVPTINGVVSPGEWTDARRIEMVYPNLITWPNIGMLRPGGAANSSVPPDSQADFSLYWFVKWDMTNLYLLGVVYDDIIVSSGTNDQPELCFNLLNNPAAQYPATAWVWYLGSVISPAAAGVPALNNAVSAYQVYSNPGRYVVEARIPWSDMSGVTGYVPSIGDVHGFGFLAQDYEPAGVRQHFLWDVRSMDDPSKWNTITLVETMPCGESGFYLADINCNRDCKVDFEDFADGIAYDWMQCTDPQGLDCIDAR